MLFCLYTQNKLVFGLKQGVTPEFVLGNQPQINLGWAYTQNKLVFGLKQDLTARLKSRIVVADKENRERQVFKKRCGSLFFENPFERFDAVPGGETTF